MIIGSAVCLGVIGCRSDAVGRRKGITAVQPRRMSGYLEFVLRERDREQRSKLSASNRSSKESILEENIRLDLEGYVYHPNLLEFSLGGLFGLVQEEYEQVTGEQRRRSGGDGNVWEFDFTGDFFQKKPYPTTVYARRYRALNPRPFQPSLETTTTSYGLNWQYVSTKSPMSLQIGHTDTKLDPRVEGEEPGRHINTLIRFEAAHNFSDHNVLSMLYTHEKNEEEPFAFNYDSDEVTVSHRLNFGANAAQVLESEFNYFDQRGTFNVERWRWRETLRLRHAENLRSWYRFEVLDRTQGNLSGVEPIDERSYLINGTVEHKLYESLTSQLNGFFTTQDFGSGPTIDRWGAQLSLNYRKKNPWGVLLLDYRARFQREDRQGGDQRAEVIDERHTFRDPEPIVLSTERVELASIHITAENKFTVYKRGQDYRARTIGQRIEIERIPTGDIPEGEPVLIDYVFNLGGSFKLDTWGQDLHVRQDFTFGLSPYYRLRWQDQTVTPESATTILPEDITAHILGVEYELGSLRLSAEHEDHQSTIDPFKAIRLGASYRHRFDWGATGSARLRWTDISYDAPRNRDTTFFTAEGRYRHPVTRHLTIEGAVLYRTQDDSLTGIDRGVDYEISLEWLIRQTELRISYELGSFDDDFSENEFSTLFIQLRRRF